MDDLREGIALMLKVLFPNEAWETYVRASVCLLHKLYGDTDEVPACLQEFHPNPALLSVWHSGCKSLSPDTFDALEKALLEIATRQYEARHQPQPPAQGKEE